MPAITIKRLFTSDVQQITSTKHYPVSPDGAATRCIHERNNSGEKTEPCGTTTIKYTQYL